MSRIADVARAPDVLTQRIELRDASAFAQLLGTGRFELSQAAEHAALPKRDAALRDANGYLSELQAKISTQVFETVTWDGKVLVLDGYVADLTTAFPHAEMPRWSFASPAFATPPESWKALYAKLSVLPAKKTAYGDERTLDFASSEGRASVTLYRQDTFDANNQPVVRWTIIVAFGPTIAASEPATPAKRPGC
jgi:hypothetical protein